MLDNVQILTEQGQAKFAVIDFEEYQFLKMLLSDEEQLEDYLDHLHIQKIKQQTTKRYTLEEVKNILNS
jgi:hypothetical protein